MKLITNSSESLKGAVTVPGDKSLSHRAALFAALADGISRIENFQVSGVTKAMLEGLQALGNDYCLEGNTLVLQGSGLNGWHQPASAIDCGNSATTMRLLAGALALTGVSATLDGSRGLRMRPMERILNPLRLLGVPISSAKGKAPLHIAPTHFPLRALNYTLPVASAQVKTCLLLAALAADGPTVLYEPGPSRDHTERMLRHQEIDVDNQIVSKNGRRIYQTTLQPPKQPALAPLNINLPGDFSSAAFLIVSALIVPGSDITLRNVGLNPTRTGLLDALLAMGADIHILNPSTQNEEPAGDLQIRHSVLSGVQIKGEQVVRMIDEFPVFAVAAAYAQGITTVEDGAELRHKESDRISSLCRELRTLGVDILERQDGFAIKGNGVIPGGQDTYSHGDHRLAMSLLVAGLAASEPVRINGAEMLTESYPGFVQALQSLGATIYSGGEP